jgi:hypothetical protein
MIWALELDAADAPVCGPLRDEPGIEARLVDGRMWLRGATIDESLAARLRGLPARGRYRVVADGALVADGARVPQGRLPEGTWLPLRAWLPVEAPAPGIASTPPALARVGLTLVRGGTPREANLLEVPFDLWLAHAEVAPAIRLARLSFAVADGGTTLVRGTPLPALPGTRLVEEGGVAVAAGMIWSPPVPPALVRTLVGAADGDLVVVLQESGATGIGCTVVPADGFVRATRAAVRLTARAFGGPVR